MGRPGTVPDSGLSGRSEVVRLHCRRCCGPYANRCHRVFLGSSCRSPLHGWIPMAADGSVDRWRRFFACWIIRKRDPTGIPCARSQRKNSLPSARGAVRGLPSCPRLPRSSALFRLSSQYGHRRWRSRRTCWFEPAGQRGAAAHSVSVVFRQQCACPTDANWFRLSAFYLLARPT